MIEYEELRADIDRYLMGRFKYRKSLVRLTVDNIIATRRNSQVDLYLRIRRVESRFPRQGGYFEVYLNPWDYAAGILLVEEAGGKVTDWIGNKLNPRQGNQVIGTNGNIHQELLRIL